MKRVHVVICLIILSFAILLIGCQKKESAQDTIFEYAINYSENRYDIPDLAWGSTIQTLLSSLDLSEEDIQIMSESDAVVRKDPVSFESLSEQVTVRYVFQDSLLIGVDYIIPSDTDEELKMVCEELADQAQEVLPDPDVNLLSEFRQCRASLKWYGKDGSILSMSLPITAEDAQKALIISVRASHGQINEN
jgi:hypothetical protein